jgi:hypothetical protein
MRYWVYLSCLDGCPGEAKVLTGRDQTNACGLADGMGLEDSIILMKLATLLRFLVPPCTQPPPLKLGFTGF